MLLSLALSTGCTPTSVGTVVSDVRIASGWISVDRCDLVQVMGSTYRLRHCATANYYLGPNAIPRLTTTSSPAPAVQATPPPMPKYQ